MTVKIPAEITNPEIFNEELLDHMSRLVYSALNFHQYNSDRGERDEAVQDIFTFKILPNYANYDLNDGALSGWIYAVTRNWIIDKSRKSTRNTKGHFLMAQKNSTGYSRHSIQDNFFDQERLAESIHKAIGLLAPKYSTILTLFYFKEFSYSEVAKEIGSPVNTVKWHIFRAKKLLFEQLRDDPVIKELGFC